MRVKNAHANASTETMNRTSMKIGVSWLFLLKPLTNHESMPTIGIKVMISVTRQLAKRMPGIMLEDVL